MKNENNIEDLFKDAFDAYEVDPGASAWSGIESGIQAGASSATSAGFAASSGGASSALVTTIVALSIGAVAIGGYFYFDNQGKSKVAPKEEQTINAPEKEIQTEAQIQSNQEKEQTEIQPLTKETNKNLDSETATNTSSEKASDVNNEKYVATKAAKSGKKVSSTSLERNEISEEGKDASSSNNDLKTISENSTTEDSNNPSSVTEEISESVSTNPTPVVDDNQSTNDEVQTTTQPVIVDEAEKKEVNPLVTEIFDNVTNVITPNQDGTNDIFMIQAEGVDRIEVQVYNRTQKLIHEWKSIYGYWDGRLNDQTFAPEGIYFYTLLLEIDGEIYTKKGTLTLLK